MNSTCPAIASQCPAFCAEGWLIGLIVGACVLMGLLFAAQAYVHAQYPLAKEILGLPPSQREEACKKAMGMVRRKDGNGNEIPGVKGEFWYDW